MRPAQCPYRPSDPPDRRPSEGHRPGDLCGRLRRARPAARLHRLAAPSPPAASSRSTPRRRGEFPGVVEVLPTRTGARPHRSTGNGTTMSPRRATRSGRCIPTGSCSTASRSRWSSPKASRLRAMPRRWCGPNMNGRLIAPASTSRGRPAYDPPDKRAGIPRPAEAARRCRRRIRQGGDQVPAGIPDRAGASPSDGDVRLDLRLGGRRQADDLRQDPGLAECSGLCRPGLRPEPEPTCRSSISMSAAHSARACGRSPGVPRRDGQPRAETLGPGRPDARADVPHRLPAGNVPDGRPGRRRRRHAPGGDP